MFRLIRLFAVVAMLGACAAQPARAPIDELPTLRLSPASLGRELALQQQLTITFGAKSQTLDALLEVDAQELRLGVQALGQSALTMRWDGTVLEQRRAEWLPPALRADQVLFDLQLVFWPAESIRAVLPADWSLVESAGQRQLFHAGTEVVSVSYPDKDHATLSRSRNDYRLEITSTAVAGAGQ